MEKLLSKDFDYIKILATVHKWPEPLYITIQSNVWQSNPEWRNLLDKEVNEYFSEKEKSILKLYLIDSKSSKEIAKDLLLSFDRTTLLLNTALKKIDSEENRNINILLSLVMPDEFKENKEILYHDLFNFIFEVGIKSAKKIIKNDSINLSFRKGSDPESINIEDLNFSQRTYNALDKGNIITLADILKKSEKELLLIRNIGKDSKNEILSVIEELELQLQPDKE